jgi:UDP-glucose 4-epimerase
VFDFYQKLRANPDRIEVLGNGQQRKSYLYVQDCVEGMLHAFRLQSDDGVQVFNLGTDEYCAVDDSLAWISAALGLAPRRQYSGGERGWIGDSPFIYLDTARIRALGWQPRLCIRDAVLKTLHYLQANEWLLERR